MRGKYQSLILFAISAVVVVLVGGLILGLAGLYILAPTAEAQTQASSAIAPESQAGSTSTRTITVVGEGTISAKPDLAQANIGVEVVGSDVKQASNEAASTMEALLTALQDQGVAEKDIQTSYYNVWVERPYQGPGESGGEAIYHVNNNVMVTIRDLDNVATLLGAAIEAGANNINSINFSVADPSLLRSEARQKAVDNALAEAQELADLNGVEVGEVISVSEVISGGAYYVSELTSSAEGRGGGGGGPISPGEVDLSVQLQVTYAIK